MLDFGFQSTVASFVAAPKPSDELKAFFEQDDYYTDADSNVYSLPTFIGNHDMGRIGFFIRPVVVLGAFAAVMIINRVVQPGRHFRVFFMLGDIRRIGPAGVVQFAKILFGLNLVALETLVDRRAIDTASGGVRVLGFGAVETKIAETFLVGAGVARVMALAVLDHVGGVVGNNIEENFDAFFMGALDQRFQILVSAEVGIDPGKIQGPITVIAGGGAVGVGLNRFVFEDRPHPDRGDAHVPQIIQFGRLL